MRFLHAVIVFAAAVSLVGCGDEDEQEGDDSADVVVQEGALAPANGYTAVSSIGCPSAYPYRKFVLGRWRCYATP